MGDYGHRNGRGGWVGVGMCGVTWKSFQVCWKTQHLN